MQIDFSNIKNYFVAYIDILGFSNMVLNDFEKNDEAEKNIDKLYSLHKKTSELTDNVDILQFSDSIVLATEFDKHKFKIFINMIAKYQYALLCQGILCRGGIAYGKHFFDDGFMYSAGLIEAYKIEKDIAVNPKIVISIVISMDLFTLIYPYDNIEEDLSVLREDDGTVFVDYLKYYTTGDSQKIDELLKKNSSIKIDAKILSKIRWLQNYIGFKIPEKNINTKKFFR